MDVILDPNRPAGAPGAGNAAADLIKDGDQKTFMQDVVEASRETPILVDFWATWCGPCKTLTPTLEKVVNAAGGRVKLVKIDIDKNRALVQQLTQLGLPLQSVPTVAAFWQGQIADLFQGALPEGDVKRFVEGLLKMAGGQMPAADLLAEGKAAAEAGDHQAALQIFGALVQQDPENPEAFAGVGRQAQAKRAEFEARLAVDPNDHAARIDLAVALNAAEDRAGAIDALIEAIKRDLAWNDEAARKQLLQFFEAWGFTDPATLAGRRKLSSLLFR